MNPERVLPLSVTIAVILLLVTPVALAGCSYSWSGGVHYHSGTSGNDICNDGQAHDEDFFLGDGSDEAHGHEGPDIMRMWPGQDEARGGAGHDTIGLQSEGDFAYGGYGNDKIYGGWGPDKLYGLEYDDELWDEASDSATAEKDVLCGTGLGSDYLDALDGDPSDTLYYSSGDSIRFDKDQNGTPLDGLFPNIACG